MSKEAIAALRDELAKVITDATDNWEEPLDFVHDSREIAIAILAHFEVKAR